jgi:HTH-type transcriptional regulator / antitoxin HigA
MSAESNTPQGDELELLSLLVHDYEEKVFPIDKPDPVAAIRFRMEQQDLKPEDLVPFLGSRSRVSEVLSGRRHLSLKMIRALVGGLGIPAEPLLGRTESA